MSKYSDNMPPSLKGAIEWMYGYIKPESVLLDFGCSTGYFGEYIKKHKNCTVYGVEISNDIEQARKVLDGVYSFDLDGNWPNEVYERTYDYLFFGDVIEHVKNPRLVLENCHKLLNNDGKIFISTPNVAHLSTRLELMAGNFEYEPMGILDETHLKYFTKNSLKKIVRDAGFSIDVIDYSTNDYPKEVTEQLLEKLDLKPGRNFWKMTKSVEARAFQYKLVLSKLGGKTKKKHNNVMVPEKPAQYRDDLLKKHADEQARIIGHQAAEIKRLERLNKT
jgi:2-polyprenyl-3-methyl-5-hydroxy-6-metoxy-1,4-benzoquinol methylase